MTSVERVLSALEALGQDVRTIRADHAWMAQCPAHADRNPSLSVRWNSKGTALKCFAGCEQADVLGALGVTWPELFDDYQENR